MSAGGKFGFIREPNGRGTIDLLWSCLFTWILCLWAVFHINIPSIEFQRMRNSVAIEDLWRAKDWPQTPHCHALLMSASTLAAIHCSAWSFSFPTIVECWLWRTSSLMILLMPIIG